MTFARTRIPLVLLAAALAAAAALLAASGADSARRPLAKASAFERDSGSSRRGQVTVSGDGSRSTRRTAARGSVNGRNASASATASSSRVSIFGGLVTARGVSVRASAADGRTSASGSVTGLRIDGRRRGSPTRAHRYSMGGKGTLYVLRARGSGIAGLRAVLSEAHAGHPAGSTVTVAFASARARDGSAPRRPRSDRDDRGDREKGDRGGKGGGRRAGPAKRRKAPRLRRLRTSRGFAFPVHGKSRYSNDWGAPRAITIRHEGTDIFAPTGAPVVAVTDGELFRVGTRPVPGNRTWLMSEDGDSFFYAHLSAFAHDARNGAKVKAGDVIGFVGSTGDAEQTPPHLHFEVHPDNGDPVNPYPFLRAWQDRRDVPRAAWLTRYGADPGSRPGALVVLEDYLER